MVDKVNTAVIKLWGKDVGAVSWLESKGYAVFEYEPEFLRSGLDISPIHMSLDDARHSSPIFSFPVLNEDTFSGLPGLLADVLPDKFGNSIIDEWLSLQGRSSRSFSPIERLCYTGNRGIGALEFSPAVSGRFNESVPVDIANLVTLAQDIMTHRESLDVTLSESERENSEAMMDIIRVGTSAGGARPKAVIAMNSEGNILSGQSNAPKGYDYWILKFDGVDDIELGKIQGFGRIEYAYYLMAGKAGINMSKSKLLEENGRAHFMTKRFDRVDGEKLHMQSLCGIAHYDFNRSGSYSYEQAFGVMRKLGLSKKDAVQQYRRMLFNIISRNQDDHTKNIAFLMSDDGEWKLSPAYDVTYSHNPGGAWTHAHQMSAGGKRDHFTKGDLIQIGKSISLPKPEAIIDEVMHAVEMWPTFAKEAGVKQSQLN